MSKVAIITDTHLGARNNSKVFRDMFREYYRDVFFPYLSENGITQVIHGGDFFDNRNSLSLHDVDYVVNEFLPLLEQHNVHMTIIAGNHDVAYRNTNSINSLSLLKTSHMVSIVEDFVEVFDPVEPYENHGTKKFVLCPWINEENSERLLKDLNRYANDDYIAIMHAEIVGAKMYKTSKVCEHGIEPKTLSKFHKVLSGHFHHPSRIGNIEYLGALFHFNWQDHGDWRGFHVYDPHTNEFEAIENPYCLFTEIEYGVDEVDSDFIEDQIVRLVINQEYDKVKLKDFINKLEKMGPISLDVIDNTVIESHFAKTSEEYDETKEEVKVKEIREYAEEATKPLDNGEKLMSLFDSVYDKAKERMKEIE